VDKPIYFYKLELQSRRITFTARAAALRILTSIRACFQFNLILIFLFVLIVENEPEEFFTHQADNTIRPVKCCVVCCFSILMNYNLYTNAYPALYLSYKLLLTFSVTQVGCERSFSKLKYVKNYLRNSITQDHLESFILMNVEKEILTSIFPATIIDKVALNSEALKKLLLY
jgi:hypothetical protein